MLNFLRTDDQFEGSPTNGKLAGLLIIKHELLVFEEDFGPFASVIKIQKSLNLMERPRSYLKNKYVAKFHNGQMYHFKYSL